MTYGWMPLLRITNIDRVLSFALSLFAPWWKEWVVDGDDRAIQESGI